MTYEDIPSAYVARAEVLAGVLGREVAPDDPDREVIEPEFHNF